jgi:uncharacterized protein (DUF1697 family)
VTVSVALLRGINVGGRTRITMDDLRRLFADLGQTEVKTYLQTGNVIFKGPAGGPSAATALSAAVEQRIAADLGIAVSVLLRTADDLDKVVASNPYLDRESDPTKLHVTFLAAAPDEDRAGRLVPPSGVTDSLTLVGREVFLHCPDGYGRTKLSNAFVERRLGLAATTRNWKTVVAVRDLACGA